LAHLPVLQTSTKTGGASPAGRVANITRQPVHALSRGDQQLRYIQEGREDLVYTQSRNLPPWADTPHTYFQAAERYEGKNRVAFTELKISLPREIGRTEQRYVKFHRINSCIASMLALVIPPTPPAALWPPGG